MDLEYKIKTTAELAGAAAAADALERQIGKAKALKQDYSALQGQLDTMRGSIEEAKDEMAASSKVLEQTGIAAKDFIPHINGAEDGVSKFSFKGREMREIVGELNRVFPGLGIALRGVGEVALESGTNVATAEGEVAAATEGLVASAGPLVIVVLAIKAAMEYWDLDQDKVKEVAEAQTAALEKIQTVTREAFAEQEKYTKALAEASEPHDKYAAALEREEAVFNAQIKSKRDLMKLDEQDALAKAKTPEERDAIKHRYAGIEAGLDSETETGKAALLKKTIADIDKELQPLIKQRAAGGDEYLDEISRDKWLTQVIQQGPDGKGRQQIAQEMAETTARNKSLDEKIVSLQEKKTGYNQKLGTDEAVHAVSEDERLRASDRTVSREVESIDKGAQSGHVSPDMKEANQALTDLFSKYSGGIGAMTAIVKYHIAQSTTQGQEIEALKNALETLRQQSARNAHTLDFH